MRLNMIKFLKKTTFIEKEKTVSSIQKQKSSQNSVQLVHISLKK